MSQRKFAPRFALRNVATPAARASRAVPIHWESPRLISTPKVSARRASTVSRSCISEIKLVSVELASRYFHSELSILPE